MKTIKELAESIKFTMLEKNFLKVEANKFEIDFNFEAQKNCNSCWRDLAILIYSKQKDLPKAETEIVA
ncbi:MAG TPA: hypothetical protein DCS17_07435, partial [Flavobacterium sp.]|nr:hypothetical protein [Flavobacterium sp.]